MLSIRDAFSDRFAIVPAPAHGEFVPARLKKWTAHPYIREVGRVTIAAVADVDGRMRNPVVIGSTNRRLNRMFRETVRYWVCEPARVNGRAVPTVTTRTVEVRFREPVRIY